MLLTPLLSTLSGIIQVVLTQVSITSSTFDLDWTSVQVHVPSRWSVDVLWWPISWPSEHMTINCWHRDLILDTNIAYYRIHLSPPISTAIFTISIVIIIITVIIIINRRNKPTFRWKVRSHFSLVGPIHDQRTEPFEGRHDLPWRR